LQDQSLIASGLSTRFQSCVVKGGDSVSFIYSTTLSRWVEVGSNGVPLVITAQLGGNVAVPTTQTTVLTFSGLVPGTFNYDIGATYSSPAGTLSIMDIYVIAGTATVSTYSGQRAATVRQDALTGSISVQAPSIHGQIVVTAAGTVLLACQATVTSVFTILQTRTGGASLPVTGGTMTQVA
jgi:hypothetical protein